MRARTVGSALGLLAAALAGCADLRPPADVTAAPTIRATGTGRLSVRPDTALVPLGAETRATNVADATAEAARRVTDVLQRVRALGVDERDITTVEYAVEPLLAPRRAPEEPTRILGYRVLNVVQLRVRQLDAVGRIVDAAIAAGANVVRGMTFILADPAAADAQARTLAVQSAAAKARQLAEAAGVRLGELVQLVEGEPVRQPRLDYIARAELAAPGPIEPGELEIVVSVVAHYRIAR